MKNKGIYVHIPFCVRKCAYCDFLSFPAGDELKKAYTGRLLKEIADGSAVSEGQTVDSIFIGGGTPSVPEAADIVRILEQIKKSCIVAADAEISIEANPGTVTEEKLALYREAGINRISFGAQSFNDDELKLLGRIHRSGDISECFEAARRAGFENINLDLMTGLPGQTKEVWSETLDKAIGLSPEHISVYSLIIEEGTAFYGRYHGADDIRAKGGTQSLLPSEEEERLMVVRGAERLAEAGYAQYEISNYAREGYECRHNLKYWLREDYLGFGLGAASCLGNFRYKNTSDMKEYLEAEDIRKDREYLTAEEELSEAIFLGLRLNLGVDIKELEKEYGADASCYLEWTEKMLDEGLLIKKGENIALSGRGRDLANYVWSGYV